jgi:hypothetical protein
MAIEKLLTIRTGLENRNQNENTPRGKEDTNKTTVDKTGSTKWFKFLYIFYRTTCERV